MKKIALLFLSATFFQHASAQLVLSGTSYTQNFDNIATGLPLGWEVDSIATATTKGYPARFDTSKVSWSSSKFHNYASKGSLAGNTTTTNQAAATNRALGLKSTDPYLDSSGAFVLQIANTSLLTNFHLTFKLMSLDSSAERTSIWRVDYGLGTNPATFTSVTPVSGTLTTGNNTFSSSTISLDFGAALNNQSGPVTIRIVSLNKTTGSNNRPTTGIDDFQLTWTSSNPASYRPMIMTTTPADNAANIAVPATISFVFDRPVVAHAGGNIYIKNVTDQTLTTKSVTSADVVVNGKTVTVSNPGLTGGKQYFVKFDSAAFDTATYKSYGIYDSTTWNFSTIVTNTSVATISGSDPVAVIGEATGNNINILYTSNREGTKRICIYDLSGKIAYNKTLWVEQSNRFNITDANLKEGIYFLKIGDEYGYGTARFFIK